MTAIQLPTSSGREDWSQEERVEELRAWRNRLRRPGAHDWLQNEVAVAMLRRLVLEHIGCVDRHFVRAADLAELSRLRKGLSTPRRRLGRWSSGLEPRRSVCPS